MLSLDLVVLGNDGRPERDVQIGVHQHARLMELVNARGASLFQRLHDYYEDALFEVSDLEALAEEGRSLAGLAGDDTELMQILEGVLTLVAFAKEKGKPIEALAD